MQTIVENTSKKEQQLALKTIKTLSSNRKSKQKTVKFRLDGSDELITIPIKAFKMLQTVLENMAEGNSITLIPSHSELSTQQAAKMLNVSRPHVVKLLEEGQIPFTKAGTHRRINLKDLIEYEKELVKRRKKNLKKLSKQAQSLNLGY